MNVAGAAVSSPTDVQTKLSEVRNAGKHSVLMRVKSGEQVRYVALPLATG
jgi:serine protease Do